MRKNPERTAWVVLLSAFITFCVLCVGMILLVRWFVRESTVQLVVELAVSRNTVGVSVEGRPEETERVRRTLNERTTLTTDSTSQAFITFRDPYSGRLLASFTLLRDSAVIIQSANRPRFEAGASPYVVELFGARGRGDVLIASGLERDIQFRVRGAYDAMIELEPGGSYGVTLGGEQVGVAVRSGEARIGLATAQLWETVGQGQRAVVPGSNPEHAIEVSSARRNILVNNGFELYDPTGEGLPLLPSSWGCYNDNDEPDEPRGETVREFYDGRAVLHIRRAGENLSHAETGCRQLHSNLDVSAYSQLELRAVFYIAHQSISSCGILGSECPLMLRLVYADVEGNIREWIHGFYSLYTIPEWPLTCNSCRQDHERINGGTWYTYESGNLATTLPADIRIHSLLEVRFYSSGHAYDVLVDEISLLVMP